MYVILKMQVVQKAQVKGIGGKAMKKFLCLLLSVLMIAGAFSLSAFAADNVVYIAFNGNNDNDGRSAAAPKKSLGGTDGAANLLKSGGTLVVSQKMLIGGANYTWEIPSAVTITANYGGVDYKNPEPANNPASGMMKFSSGGVLHVKSDLTIDDIILFQEFDQNTIVVESGGTLTITDKVVCMSAKPYYLNIEVEAGGKAVINGGIYSSISGDGDIQVADGVQILGDTQEQPVEQPEAGSAGIAFISFAGSDGNSGTSADSPKKSFGTTSGKGVFGLLPSGGTLVVTGKAYVGVNFEFPALPDTLTVTSNYGGVDYKNPAPADNPNCAFKMGSFVTLAINSDVIFDDIILFQENGQNTIKVNAGATLVITDKAVLQTKPGNDYHFKIAIEPGATAILSEEAQKVMTIVNNGGTLLPYESENAPVDTPKFTASRTYQNQFTDVAEGQWFHSFVKTAYEYALANGTSETKFSPDGRFTVAQALTAAVNIHKAYNGTTVRTAAAGEAWYAPYVEYCVQNGIIKDGQFTNLDANITRGDMAVVFANILPDSEYAAVRDGSNPDVTGDMSCAAAVQKLANAGIVGGDDKGNFNPANEITRAEACVIFTRIAVADMRDAK